MPPLPIAEWSAGFLQPRDLATALAIRGWYRNEILPVAGATLVARQINAGEFDGARILDLSRIDNFAEVELHADRIEIGAGTPFRRLESISRIVSLSTASRGVGGPAIRNRATLGGNLASARNDGDGSVAALALPTLVELNSLSCGIRRISIDDFFGNEEGKTAIREDELLTKIIVFNVLRSAWQELGVRLGASHSLVCCAASLSENGEVRIAFGGVAGTVCRVREAEEIATAGELSDRSLVGAVAATKASVNPATDWRATSEYRREMCAVLARRALLSLRETRNTGC